MGHMKKNVGTVDRFIRLVLGLVLLLAGLMMLGAMDGNWTGILAAVVGVVLLGTSATGVCLIYKMIGCSTCKVDGMPGTGAPMGGQPMA